MRVLHLVVVAVIVAFIVLIVGSIAVVAIAKVRAAADRTNCANNMKMLGLCLHNYRDTYGYYPPAAKPKPLMPIEHRLSWTYLIIPFVESSNFYNEFTKDKGWDSEENRFAALTPCRIYQCPSYPDRPPDSKFIPSHYLGIPGLGTDAATLPLEDPKAGFFGYERKIKKGDIKNGLSNMLGVVETAWGSGAWTAAPDSVRGLDPAGSPYLGVPRQFGGNHPGGAMALFADGSVHFLESSFDPQAFERMATIAGSSPDSP